MDVLVLVSELEAEVGVPTLSIVPVHVEPETDTPVIEIVFSGGDRLHVRAGAAPELVRAALSALRSPC